MEQIAMPQLGETVTEGTIVRWLRRVGDEIMVDDPLFEVSTDKVDTEVPCAFSGYVRAILVAEGDTVPIGTPVAIVTNTADEPIGERVGDAAAAPAEGSPGDVDRRQGHVAEPAARVARSVPPTETSTFLSPAVRRLLGEHRLVPADVVGSGRDGRITRNDVLAAAANHHGRRNGAGNGRAGSTTDAAGRRHESDISALPPGPDDDVVELSRARRATAVSTTRSLATAAHALVVTEVDYSHVDAVRRSAGLTYLPFVARAMVEGLRAFPHVNASIGDDDLVVHRRVHLGVAIDIDFRALVVPVVRDAEGKRLKAIADEVAELAQRARAKRLVVDDFAGATITLTNVGSYGTLLTAPIINLPQVAIVSTDGVQMRPVAVPLPDRTWGMAVHPVGNLSLSFDHRAFDGAYAAAFLASVRDTLATADWEAEL